MYAKTLNIREIKKKWSKNKCSSIFKNKLKFSEYFVPNCDVTECVLFCHMRSNVKASSAGIYYEILEKIMANIWHLHPIKICKFWIWSADLEI